MKRPGVNPMTESDRSPSQRGVHYLVYKSANQELHTLHWLDPETFGPFDHIWKDDANEEGADILCTDEDGDLVDSCGAGDVKGVTDYRVTVTDEDGNTEYVDEISADAARNGVFSADFNLNDGTYTFAVDAGYMDDGKFYALSDKAQVEFDIPDDYRKYNQDLEEIAALVGDILGDVKDEDEDFDAFYGSVWNYQDWEGDGSEVVVGPRLEDTTTDPNTPAFTAAQADNESRERALTVYLNNLYN